MTLKEKIVLARTHITVQLCDHFTTTAASYHLHPQIMPSPQSLTSAYTTTTNTASCVVSEAPTAKDAYVIVNKLLLTILLPQTTMAFPNFIHEGDIRQ